MAKPRPRSIAFASDGSMYLLMAQGSSPFLLRHVGNDKFEFVRRVGNNLWWFHIHDSTEGRRAIFHEDEHGSQTSRIYDLDSGNRATRTKIYVAAFHSFASSLQSGQYSVAGGSVHRYENGDWLNLDEPSVSVTKEENEASFFSLGDEKLVRGDGKLVTRRLGEKWQEVHSHKNRLFKQMAFDPKSSVLALAGRSALFVGKRGRTTEHKRDGGLWSVCAFQGRFFFNASSLGIIEISQTGKEVVHGENGRIVRNQCLFANDEALYFVTEDKIRCYQQGKWRTIDVVTEATRLLAEIAPKNTKKPSQGEESALQKQLARVYADPANDAERMVYGDLLSEAGSLRGEFIALQLLEKKNMAQRSRISELTKAHGESWVGALLPLLVKKGRSFDRGFLNKCEFKKIPLAELVKALAMPELSTVTSLCIHHQELSDLSPLSRLTELRELEIWAPVHDLSSLASLKNLRSLRLYFATTEDLAPLSKLTKLQKLYVQKTNIRSLAPLQSLFALEELDISQTKVKSLQPLAKLTKLKRLELNRTSVASITPLAKLTKLEVLNFRFTQASNLSALSKLTELEYLTVASEVDDTKPFASLLKLSQLCHDGVSPAKLAKIKRLLPRLRIV